MTLIAIYKCEIEIFSLWMWDWNIKTFALFSVKSDGDPYFVGGNDSTAPTS